MALPNFLIIGAPRSGTTSLYQWLRSHPDVFMPAHKEPMFFLASLPPFRGPYDDVMNRLVIRSRAAYEALFDPGAQCVALGEASVYYLYYAERSAHSIRKLIPDCKLICILRDPVDRAFSAYKLLRRDGWDNASFERALELESSRVAAGWNPTYALVGAGEYGAQLATYRQLFPPDQLLALTFEELVANPAEGYRRICRFLGVRDDPMPLWLAYNRGWVPRSPLLHKLMVSVHNQVTRRSPSELVTNPHRMQATSSKLFPLFGRVPQVPGGLRAALAARFCSSNQTVHELFPDLDLRPWGQGHTD